MKTSRRTLGSMLLGVILTPGSAGSDPEPENRLDAEVLRIELDQRLEPGRKHGVRITVRNSGTLRWEKGEYSVRLARSERPDRRSLKPKSVWFEEALDQEVLPGETVMVTGTLVGPEQPGRWELVAAVLHGRDSLGKALERKIEVQAEYRARIESVRIEDPVRPQRDTEITLRVLNNGKSEWGLEETDLFLTVRKASGSTSLYRDDWEMHVPLPKPVPPNTTVELRFKVRPRRSGQVTLQFAMWDRDRRDDFGEVEYREVTIA